MQSADVAIVGGGVAGIAAASRLISSGITNVVVIEAEGRLGGRVYTKAFGTNYVDIGAHWIHGQGGNPVYQIVGNTGLVEESGDFENLLFFTSEGTEVVSSIGMTLYHQWSYAILNKAEREAVKGSLEDYIKPKFKEAAYPLIDNDRLRKAFYRWLSKFESSIEGCDRLKDVSAGGLSRYKDCEGDLLVHWKHGGYTNIIDILLNRHPTIPASKKIQLEDKTLFNCRVKDIDWSEDEVVINCTNGSVVKAKYAIITVSLGVLKECHADMFNPPLPLYKINAIRNLGFGSVNKIYLKFPSRWWPEGCSGFSFLYTDQSPHRGEFEWEREFMGFYCERAAPLVLCGWLVGEPAKRMEEASDHQVITACTKVLRKFLGKTYEIPEPEAILRSQWHSNPNFRGAYSYHSIFADKVKTSAMDLARPCANQSGKEVLLFAGEATHNFFYSTVHGAMETGWREADRVIDALAKDIRCNL